MHTKHKYKLIQSTPDVLRWQWASLHPYMGCKRNKVYMWCKIYPTLWMLHIILNVMCTVYNYICRKLQDISSNESNPISVQKMFVPWYWSVVLSVVGHGTISEQVVLQSISGIGLVGGRGSKIILLAKEIQLRHAVHHRMVSNRSSYILSRIVARVWWERLLFLGPNPKIGRKGSKIIRAYDWIVATHSHGSGGPGDSGVPGGSHSSGDSGGSD